MRKDWSVFGGCGGVRVFRDSNYKFYLTTLIRLIIKVQTERCCIACYFSLMFLAYFILSKVYFNSVSFHQQLIEEEKWIKLNRGDY